MPIPDYQTLMLPMLVLLSDGQPRRVVPGISDVLADKYHLTEEERLQLLPSGAQPTFINRTHWASTYLSKAGLIVRPTRGHVQITDRGRAALATKPDRIDLVFLRNYPEFNEFRTRSKPSQPTGDGVVVSDSEANPEELLFATYDALRTSIEADILDRLYEEGFRWDAFERLVVELLKSMGYGDFTDEGARVTKKSNDEGIDGVIDQDKLGLDAVYIQAKNYARDNVVGRPDLQKFAGSLEGQRASKGVFITTSRFSAEARDYVERISRRIVLIDGRQLARLMYDNDIGVRSRRVLEVKKVDEAFFEGDV